MPSLKSRLFVFMLKYRHLLKGQLIRRKFVDSETCLAELRAEVEKGAEFFGKLPEGFCVEPVQIGRLNAEWVIPPGALKEKAILYFHGGGLVIGSSAAHRGIVAKFAGQTKTAVLVIDYRLAPENPYPAALEDSVAAYDWMLSDGVSPGVGIKPESIIFMGDSGGGNLVFSTQLAIKEKGIPLPAGSIALSPWVDLTNSGESWTFNSRLDSLCWRDAQIIFAKYYCSGRNSGSNSAANPQNPLVSPLFGDLSGLPPMLVFAGGHETLLSDSIRFVEKAKTAEVEAHLKVGEGLFHCWPACFPMFPETITAMKDIVKFTEYRLMTT